MQMLILLSNQPLTPTTHYVLVGSLMFSAYYIFSDSQDQYSLPLDKKTFIM